jgi:hypothetical protein
VFSGTHVMYHEVLGKKMFLFLTDEEIDRELTERILTYECRCNERLKGKGKGSTHLVYTGL